MRYFVILVLGVGAGYAIGYRDAREHDRPIVERIIDHVQSTNHGRFNSDADRQLEDIQRH